MSYALSKALTRHSHEVRVVTTNLKSSTEVLDVPLDVPVNVEGTTVYYEPTALSRYFGLSPRLYQRVAEQVGWSDLVLVHFHYQFASWAGARLAAGAGKPFVLFPHGSFNRWGIASRHSRVKRLYLGTVEKRNIENALFLAFNASEEQALSRFAEKGLVIPNGVDVDEFSELPERGSWRRTMEDIGNKLCFLYLGRLNPRQKGLDLLLPAFAQVIKRHECAHLVLAGPDERGGEAILRQAVCDLGIGDNVTFTGMITGQHKLALLQDCDAFVLASPSEGTSIALLEAMYMGLPVIVTNRVGLANEIASHRCGAVVERELTQLVDAMSTLAGNPDERAAMGHNAKHLVAERYTWDSIAKTLLSAIEQHTN